MMMMKSLYWPEVLMTVSSVMFCQKSSIYARDSQCACVCVCSRVHVLEM